MFFRYLRWKRRAKLAIKEGKITTCCICKEPIFPGQFVAVGYFKSEPDVEKLAHAGYHYSLNKKSEFCLTGALGVGYWDGEKVTQYGESTAAKAVRTGEAQIHNSR